MKMVDVRFASVRFRVEVVAEIDLVRELVSVVDLPRRPSVSITGTRQKSTDFDILIPNEIVFETLELKM